MSESPMAAGSQAQHGERVLLLGSGGMLGAAVRESLITAGTHVLATDIDLNEPWLSYLDIRDIDALWATVQEFRPTCIYNLAAHTDLEYCESHPDDAWATNAVGAENVVLLANRVGATVVYISTAGIFGGEKEFFTDVDTPNPLSYYAKAKYHGERYTETRSERYFVFRAGWMMGGGPAKDKKFIGKIFRQLQAGKRELHVVSDKLGTPTYTKDFAANMQRVIASGYYGVYNQVQGGSGSRLDVAREFVELLGLSGEVKVTPVSSDHFAREYSAPRPFSEKLVNLKLKLRGLDGMRDWRGALAEYSTIFKQQYHA